MGWFHPPAHRSTTSPSHHRVTSPPPVRDFVVSALVGGGAMAALALYPEDPFANKLGEAVMGVINKED